MQEDSYSFGESHRPPLWRKWLKRSNVMKGGRDLGHIIVEAYNLASQMGHP